MKEQTIEVPIAVDGKPLSIDGVSLSVTIRTAQSEYIKRLPPLPSYEVVTDENGYIEGTDVHVSAPASVVAIRELCRIICDWNIPGVSYSESRLKNLLDNNIMLLPAFSQCVIPVFYATKDA